MKSIYNLLIVLALFFIVGCQSQSQSFYDKVRQSSVEVLINGTLQATGFFVDESGLLLTAEHAIHNQDVKVEILTKDGRRLTAELVAIDRYHDLALLRVSDADGPFVAFELAAAMPSAGTDVYVYGTPIFRHNILLKGSVAAENVAYEWLPGVDRYQRIVYYSGMAPGGVSGGPWVNGKGQIIGLQSGGMTVNGAQTGIAFVAPLDAVVNLVRTQKNVVTPSLYIAVNELWERDSNFIKKFPYGTKGLVVAIIRKDSPLADTSCQNDDIIIAVDGQNVEYRDELMRIIEKKNIGDNLELTLLKPDSSQPYKLSVRLKSL